MKYVLSAIAVIVLAAVGLSAYLTLFPADKVATLSNGVTITFHSTKCNLPEIKDFLEGQFQKEAFAATVNIPAELAEQVGVNPTLKACYVDVGSKMAVADEAGNGGFVSKTQIK